MKKSFECVLFHIFERLYGEGGCEHGRNRNAVQRYTFFLEWEWKYLEGGELQNNVKEEKISAMSRKMCIFALLKMAWK